MIFLNSITMSSRLNVTQMNKMFTFTRPWKMEDPTGPIVYAYTALRLSGIMMQPVMPAKAAELLDRLGVPEDKRRWEDAVWPVEVDAVEIKQRLREANERWSGKGFLFPQLRRKEEQVETP